MFAVIFSGTYSAGTLLLWLTYFMGLVIVYLLTSWLPTLMRDSGASMEQAAFIGALFQFGGVLSAVGVGWAMDRFNPHKVIGTFYLLAGVFAYAVGQSLGDITLLATLVLVAGMCVNGAQSAMPSLAARFYPTQGRATGCRGCSASAASARSWGVDGRYLAGPGLELRAGAHGAGDSGGIGHGSGGDQGHGQPCRCHLKPITTPVGAGLPAIAVLNPQAPSQASQLTLPCSCR